MMHAARRCPANWICDCSREMDWDFVNANGEHLHIRSQHTGLRYVAIPLVIDRVQFGFASGSRGTVGNQWRLCLTNETYSQRTSRDSAPDVPSSRAMTQGDSLDNALHYSQVIEEPP